MLKYKLKETPINGVSIYQVESLEIKIIENYNFHYDFINRDNSYEIEINKNRIVFEVINEPSDFIENYAKNVGYQEIINNFIEIYKTDIYDLPKLKKFEFLKEFNIIRHNLEPRFILEVIKNNEEEYDVWNDVYDLFEFRGNQFAFVILWSEIDLDEVKDFSLIRSVINRAWKWYKSQVHIEKYVPQDGAMEDERFLLQESKDLNWWICTDKINGIVIKFKHKMFNESQEVTTLEELDVNDISVSEVATIMREIGDWLNKNHSGKL